MASIKIYLDEVRPGDFWNVASHMRQQDRDECMAYCGASPLEGVLASLQGSLLKWTIRAENGKAIGLFGVGSTSALADKGAPWLLATDDLEGAAVTFLKRSKGLISEMLAQYSFLENYVDARNHISLKWLRWCGFEICDPAPYGIEGRMFHRFEMRR